MDVENSVSAEFWEALFREHRLCQQNFGISENIKIANVPSIEYTFDVPNNVDLTSVTADMVLVNQTPQAGYDKADIVHAFGIGNRPSPRPIVFASAGGLCVRQLVNSESFWVSHKTTGNIMRISNHNWKAKFRIWH